MLEPGPRGVDFPVHNASFKTSAPGPVTCTLIGPGRIGPAGSIVDKFVPSETLALYLQSAQLGQGQKPYGNPPRKRVPLEQQGPEVF